MGLKGSANLPHSWKLLIWFVVGLVLLVVLLEAPWTFLQFSIYQHVYSVKAGLDWFTIVFYQNYTFVAAALFSLLLINPKVGHSDFWHVINEIFKMGSHQPSASENFESEPKDVNSIQLGRVDWGIWQFIKWSLSFIYFAMNEGPPLIGAVMNSVMMMMMGFGNWSNIGRIFLLPLLPASGNELINLMPSMEVQYKLFQSSINAFLLIFGLRMFFRFAANALNHSNRGAKQVGSPPISYILAIVAALLLSITLGAPYWITDIETPYMYGIVWTLFAFTVFIGIYLRFSGKNLLKNLRSQRPILKVTTVLLVSILFLQLGVLAFYSLNWNNNYLAYLWTPQTQKEITVTDWAAGLTNINAGSLTALPTSNVSTILNLVRQWDQQAASTTMTKEIGAYNWMTVASSQVVFYNQTEYWVAPTTPAYPATDWISEHLIYTHASRMMIINTHNGAAISLTQAFNVNSEPLIYYGEEPANGTAGGFLKNIYTGISGYNEISNQSFTGLPDYTFTGWEKALWFTFAEGQIGFAFSSYPIDMLWNRDIFNRVQAILIPGLTVDPAAYMVSDGQSIYYCVQVYINYPLQTSFSASPYLRFFGVVLINVDDGVLQGYTVSDVTGTSNLDFLTSFYNKYYSSWRNAPEWLLPQIRYPEQLLGNPSVSGQLDYHFQFHITDPFVWRSGSQFYERPSAANTVQYIPWAIGNKTYFVGIQLVQFQSSTSQNLAGVYIAYGGDRLGQIYIYQNPSPSNTFIGPTAAENALSTNSEVRTQETLLPNFRIGSYLLYSVGGTLTYFIALYTNPGIGGVVTQLPFMTAVDPTTGNVGLGPNAFNAYISLISNIITPVNTNISLLIDGIASFTARNGYTLVNATTLSFPVQIKVDTIPFTSTGINQTISKIGDFLNTYGPASKFGNTVYEWTTDPGSLNFGIVEQAPLGYYEVYYLKIMLS